MGKTEEVTVDNLKDCTTSLFHAQSEIKRFKSVVDWIKPLVVKYLKANGLSNYKDENGSVSITTTKSESFNEEELLPFLKEHYPEVIKTVEVVDYELLNELAYNNEKLVQDLVAFKVVKEGEKVYVRPKN